MNKIAEYLSVPRNLFKTVLRVAVFLIVTFVAMRIYHAVHSVNVIMHLLGIA